MSADKLRRAGLNTGTAHTSILPPKPPQPLNHAQRRALAKKYKIPLSEVNRFIPRRAPADIGIKKFKKLTGGKPPKGYKEVAWKALHDHNDKLREKRENDVNRSND